MTEVEKKLWQHLRSARVLGVSFRKQHPISNDIVGFCAPSLKLIIALDGGQHAETQEADSKRTAWLEREGFRVIGFWNNDIAENMDGVRQAILDIIAERKRPLPAPPRSGEGEKTG